MSRFSSFSILGAALAVAVSSSAMAAEVPSSIYLYSSRLEAGIEVTMGAVFQDGRGTMLSCEYAPAYNTPNPPSVSPQDVLKFVREKCAAQHRASDSRVQFRGFQQRLSGGAVRVIFSQTAMTIWDGPNAKPNGLMTDAATFTLDYDSKGPQPVSAIVLRIGHLSTGGNPSLTSQRLTLYPIAAAAGVPYPEISLKLTPFKSN